MPMLGANSNERRQLPLLAPNGHGRMSDLSPLSGEQRKSNFGAVRSVFDPYRKSCRLPVLASSATPEPKIIACNATQTRTHIPDRATVISIRKYTDARRNTGPRTQVWPSDDSRTGQLHGEKKHE